MPFFGLVSPHPDRRALAGGASTGEGVITRIVSAIENPFRGRRVVNLDNRQAVVGSVVDGHGNVMGRYEPPGGHGSEQGERAFHAMMVQAHMESRMDGPIYLDDKDGKAVAFGTDHETIARHAALANVASGYSVGADGKPVEISAADVLHAIGEFMASSLETAIAKLDAFGGDKPIDLDDGWPDTGSGDPAPAQPESDATPANTTGAAAQGAEMVSGDQLRRQEFEAAGGKVGGLGDVAAPPLHSPEHASEIASSNVPGTGPAQDSPATEQAHETREPGAPEGEVAMEHSQADRSNDQGGHDHNAA